MASIVLTIPSDINAWLQSLLEGNDTFEGTGLVDTINGYKGADTIWGYGGNDILHAMFGADEIVAGDGDDNVRGGHGHDLLWGQAGADFLWGGTGRNELMWTQACQGLMATWPTLPRHPRDVERIADGCANHSLDAVRYGVHWWRAKWKTGRGPAIPGWGV